MQDDQSLERDSVKSKRERHRFGPLRKVREWKADTPHAGIDTLELDCGHTLFFPHRLERNRTEKVSCVVCHKGPAADEPALAMTATSAGSAATGGDWLQQTSADHSGVLDFTIGAEPPDAEPGSIAAIVERLIAVAGVGTVNVTATIGRVKLEIKAERIP